MDAFGAPDPRRPRRVAGQPEMLHAAAPCARTVIGAVVHGSPAHYYMAMSLPARAAAAALLLCLPAAASAVATVAERDVAIPMRDGTVLRADVYLPEAAGPFPTLVFRTPYDKREAAGQQTMYRHALDRGYAVVIQDVRGRYASAGEFDPYRNEGRDGYDTIEWAA